MRWGVFSLEIQNFDKPVEAFDPARSRGATPLRTCVAVRDELGQDAVADLYQALGHRHFEGLEDLADPRTTRRALADAGLDESWVERALATEATWTAVVDEHDALVEGCHGFGVPTIRLDDGAGPGIFGPVLSNPPADDEEALELWRHVRWLVRYENFSELKRDRTVTPDLAYARRRDDRPDA